MDAESFTFNVNTIIQYSGRSLLSCLLKYLNASTSSKFGRKARCHQDVTKSIEQRKRGVRKNSLVSDPTEPFNVMGECRLTGIFQGNFRHEGCKQCTFRLNRENGPSSSSLRCKVDHQTNLRGTFVAFNVTHVKDSEAEEEED
ncbi:hypothetical protein VYU27_008578 [Nannochloropsis oceanica]